MGKEEEWKEETPLFSYLYRKPSQYVTTSLKTVNTFSNAFRTSTYLNPGLHPYTHTGSVINCPSLPSSPSG